MSLEIPPHVADEVGWLAAALAAAPGVRSAEVSTDPGLRPQVFVLFEDGTRRAYTPKAYPRTGIPGTARTGIPGTARTATSP